MEVSIPKNPPADWIPIVLGSAGLIGRTPVRPAEFTLEDEEEVKAEALGKALPANCLRVLNSPLAAGRGGGCGTDCPGTQEDGSCLCDIVRAANEQEVDWSFEINPVTGIWEYVGPELDNG